MKNKELKSSNQYVSIAVKSTSKYFVKDAELTQKEFIEKIEELPWGLYQGFDEIMGVTNAWKLPPLLKSDLAGIIFALKNINNYKKLTEKYRELINNDPLVKWYLIPFLIMCKEAKSQIKFLHSIPDWTNEELLNNKVLFLSLKKQGAEYKNYLAYGFGSVHVEYLKCLLHLFGSEATVFPGEQDSFITTYLLPHYDQFAFQRVTLLLHYGANINQRIDKQYENTLFHYLIALECTQRTLELIDLTEKLPKSTLLNNPYCQIDYNLQDKHGKTGLFLAVGLNLISVVDKLLQIMKEKQKNIGLNTPDCEGRTPLMVAAALGHKELVIKLLTSGASLFMKDKKLRDVSWYMQADENEVRTILESCSIHPDRSVYAQGASYLYSSTIDARPLVLVNEAGEETPIILSRKSPYKEKIKFVLEYIQNNPFVKYVNPNNIYRQLKPFMDVKCERPDESVLDRKLSDQPCIRNNIKEMLFFMACAFGNLETVKYYIETEKIDINACDTLSRNALHYAVLRKELVEKLLISQQITIPVNDCLKNHGSVFEYLIIQGVNIDQKNSNSNSPLDLLVRDSLKKDDNGIYAENMLLCWKNYKNPIENKTLHEYSFN